jgi:endonuclease/exonuclease/phosphatase family metal-dependent hydrolase
MSSTSTDDSEREIEEREFRLLAYDGRAWCENNDKDSKDEGQDAEASLTCLTWNCFAVVEHCGAERWLAIIDELKRLKPCVAMLQEVTKELCNALKLSDFVRAHYAATDVFGVTFAPSFYGNIVLVRRSMVDSNARATLRWLPTTMNRRLLCVALGGGAVFATVHLESMHDMAFMRAKQLSEHIVPALDKRGDAIVVLAGDFNMSSDAKENAVLESFDDVWRVLGGGEGIELPSTTQPSRRTNWRPDRVLYRSSSSRSLEPIEYTLVGCEPMQNVAASSIERRCAHIKTPSDHFGVFVRFQVTKG